MQTTLRIAAARLFAFVLGFALLPQGWSPGREVRDGLPLGPGSVPTTSLDLTAVVDAATLARGGRLAFVARAAGTGRNQLLCVTGPSTPSSAPSSPPPTPHALANGLYALAIGSGGGGGSGLLGTLGDPAPGGGTFANFFGGTATAPAQHEDGSVLFLADVHGALRALFRFDATTQQLARVAAVGDASPLGGVLTAIGPGVFGANGTVLFLAATDHALGGDLLRSANGALAAVVARGQPLPGGGTVQFVATEIATYVDGTSMPIGPLPDANACGDVVLRVHCSGGAPSSGLLRIRADGTREWLVRAGEPAPGGGTFAAFGAPRLSTAGECAFTADVQTATGGTAAWFAGRSGTWRRVLGFFDPVDGGQCLGLAMSRGPFRPLDERGDLVLWCDLAIDGGQDRIVRCARDGSIEVLARRGAPTPLGGAFGELGGWPTSDGPGRVAFGAQLVGVSQSGSAVRSAHFVLATAEALTLTAPCAPLGGTLDVRVRASPADAFLLGASPIACELDVPPLGLLRIGPDPIWLLAGPTPLEHSVDDAVVARSVPPDPSLDGLELHFQALVLDEAQFSAATHTRIVTPPSVR